MSVTLAGVPSRNVLVSPTGKQTRTLRVETWKKILRLIRESKAEGFRTTFTCVECGAPITMTAPHPTSPRLECGCTQWIGR